MVVSESTKYDPPAEVAPADLVLRIRSSADARQLAGIVENALIAGEVIDLRAVGAGAVNQAIKCATIASRYTQDIDVCIRPRFENAPLTTPTANGDTEISVMVLRVGVA